MDFDIEAMCFEAALKLVSFNCNYSFKVILGDHLLFKNDVIDNVNYNNCCGTHNNTIYFYPVLPCDINCISTIYFQDVRIVFVDNKYDYIILSRFIGRDRVRLIPDIRLILYKHPFLLCKNVISNSDSYDTCSGDELYVPQKRILRVGLFISTSEDKCYDDICPRKFIVNILLPKIKKDMEVVLFEGTNHNSEYDKFDEDCSPYKILYSTFLINNDIDSLMREMETLDVCICHSYWSHILAIVLGKHILSVSSDIRAINLMDDVGIPNYQLKRSDLNNMLMYIKRTINISNPECHNHPYLFFLDKKRNIIQKQASVCSDDKRNCIEELDIISKYILMEEDHTLLVKIMTFELTGQIEFEYPKGRSSIDTFSHYIDANGYTRKTIIHIIDLIGRNYNKSKRYTNGTSLCWATMCDLIKSEVYHFDCCIENTYLNNEDWELWKSKNSCNCESEEDNSIPRKCSWFGAIYSGDIQTVNKLLTNNNFLLSLKTCKFIIVASQRIKDYIDSKRLQLNVYKVYKPVLSIKTSFKSTTLPNCIIQIGVNMRREHSIYKLPISNNIRKCILDESCNPYKTSLGFINHTQLRIGLLPDDSCGHLISDINNEMWEEKVDSSFLLDFMRKNTSESSKYLFKEEYDACNDCKIKILYINDERCIDKLNNILKHVTVMKENFDLIMSTCAVFLDLKDSSCDEIVVECLLRQTPLLVNYHPSVVEILGDDYPLYFNSLEENEINVVFNEHNIRKAISYLAERRELFIRDNSPSSNNDGVNHHYFDPCNVALSIERHIVREL